MDFDLVEKLQSEGFKIRVNLSNFKGNLSMLDIFEKDQHFGYVFAHSITSNKTLSTHSVQEIMDDFKEEYIQRELDKKLRG